MASPSQAERWLALELVVVMVTRTIDGMRSEGGLLGAKNYAAMFVAYGFLALLVMYEPTAELAALLGLLLVVATLLRSTQSGKSLAGADSAGAVSDFAGRVTGKQKPDLAQGVQK